MSFIDPNFPPRGLTYKEVLEACATCPKRDRYDQPYMAWWSYCQKHCKLLRSCEEVKHGYENRRI
jgi:hypothetical protein